jgi:hypothetical protein
MVPGIEPGPSACCKSAWQAPMIATSPHHSAYLSHRSLHHITSRLTQPSQSHRLLQAITAHVQKHESVPAFLHQESQRPGSKTLAVWSAVCSAICHSPSIAQDAHQSLSLVRQAMPCDKCAGSSAAHPGRRSAKGRGKEEVLRAKRSKGPLHQDAA